MRFNCAARHSLQYGCKVEPASDFFGENSSSDCLGLDHLSAELWPCNDDFTVDMSSASRVAQHTVHQPAGCCPSVATGVKSEKVNFSAVFG